MPGGTIVPSTTYCAFDYVLEIVHGLGLFKTDTDSTIIHQVRKFLVKHDIDLLMYVLQYIGYSTASYGKAYMLENGTVLSEAQRQLHAVANHIKSMNSYIPSTLT